MRVTLGWRGIVVERQRVGISRIDLPRASQPASWAQWRLTVVNVEGLLESAREQGCRGLTGLECGQVMGEPLGTDEGVGLDSTGA